MNYRCGNKECPMNIERFSNRCYIYRRARLKECENFIPTISKADILKMAYSWCNKRGGRHLTVSSEAVWLTNNGYQKFTTRNNTVGFLKLYKFLKEQEKS